MPEQTAQHRLLTAITRALTKTIEAGDPATIFEAMLGEVLELTESSFGFMGEILTDSAGAPFLKTHALGNITWNRETRKLYEEQLAAGLEFHNPDTLFGRVLQTGEPLIANDLDQGTHLCGLPTGHPHLTAILGLPLRKDGEPVGIICLANRPGGYDDQCLALLQPLQDACATIITAFRSTRLRTCMQDEMRCLCAEWENIFQAIGDYALILDPGHTILKANQSVVRRTGIAAEMLVGRKCYELFHGTASPPDDCPVKNNLASGSWPLAPSEVQVLDGTFHVACTPVHDDQGRVSKIIHIATDVTPQKKAITALAESESRLATYFDMAPVGLAILDTDLRFVRINTLMAAMNGLPEQEHIGRTVRELLPAVAAQAEELATRIISTGQPELDIEMTGETPAEPGTTKIWLENWFPLTDARGTVTEFMVTAQDITARRTAEREIALHHQRLKSLVSIMQYRATSTQDLLDKTLAEALSITESAIGYICYYHEHLRQFEVCAWSEQVMAECRIPGGQTVFHLERTGLWGEAVRQGRAIMFNDFTTPNPLRRGYPEGHAGISRFLTVPVFNSDRKIVAVLGVANKALPYGETDTLQLTLLMDAAWKEIAQRQDQERILRLNRILHVIREVNQLVFQENNREYLLNAACRLLLEHRSYLCAWTLLTDAAGDAPVLYHTGFDSVAGQFLHQLRQGYTPPCLNVARRKPGVSLIHDRPTFCASCPAGVFYPEKPVLCGALQHDGTIHGFMVVVLDSLLHADSDEQQLLAVLADDLGYALHNLQQQKALAEAKTRRAEMEARLRQSQRLEAIGTLAGGIAHDFNNILSSILGYADLVKNEIQGQEPMADDIEQVISSATRATDLVRQILTLSRRTEQQLQPVRVQHLIKEAFKLLRPTITSAIDLRTEIDMQCPPIQADPTEIHQLIMNLVTNASHAMRTGGGILTISLAVEEMERDDMDRFLKLPPGHYLRLTVGDTGCGMDPAIRTKILVHSYFS